MRESMERSPNVGRSPAIWNLLLIGFSLLWPIDEAVAGTVRGTVTSQGGEAVANVRVTVFAASYGEWIDQCLSGPDGTYAIAALAGGDYTLLFDGNSGGFVRQWYDNAVTYQSATVFSLAADAERVADAVLVPGAAISGRVTNVDGSPLPGIWVNAYDATGTSGFAGGSTNAAGEYVIRGVPTGLCTISFSDSGTGYLNEWYDDQPSAATATPLQATAPETLSGKDAVLAIDRGGITGTVSADGGAPLGRVMIEVYGADGSYAGSAWTGSSGFFTVGGLAPGDYKILFNGQAAGYLREWYRDRPDNASADAVTVLAGEITKSIDETLALGGSISGTLSDADGKPLPGMFVEVYDDATLEYVGDGSADRTGTYVVGGLATGSYRVYFSGGAGYVGEWYEDQADLFSATPVPVTAPEQATASAVLARGGSISGTVTDASGNPLPDVWISLHGANGIPVAGTTTRADGTYALSGLSAGQFKVCFHGQWIGYSDTWFNDKPDAAQADLVSVIPPADTGGVDAVLARGASIAGTVNDALGNPLSGVTVWIYDTLGGGMGLSTAPDGSYRFSGLASGTYKVGFDGVQAGYVEEWHNDKPSYESADPVEIVAPAETTVDAVLVRGGSIAGRITDTDGTPVEGAWVSAYDEAFSGRGSALTNTSGEYTVGGLAGGTYKVQVSAYGTGYISEWYADKQDFDSADALVVVVTETTSMNAVLARGGAIAGVVTDAGGNPIHHAWVVVYGDGGSWADTTDSVGAYRVSGLPDGNYRVRFQGSATGFLDEWYVDKPDFSTADAVAVVAPLTTTVDAVLSQGGRVAGTVTDTDGNPIGGATVWLYESSGRATGQTTSAAGAYEFTGVASGDYKVFFSGDNAGYVSEWYADRQGFMAADLVTVLAPATTTVDAVLSQGGRVAGIVTDTDGIPIGGATVWLYDSTGGESWQATSAAGTYEFTGVASGSYRLYFSGEDTGFGSEWHADRQDFMTADVVTVVAPATTTVDAVLAPGNRVAGTVTDADGAPIDGATVSLYDSEGGETTRTTGVDGTYEFASLAAGVYKVKFQAAGLLEEWYADRPDFAGADPVMVTARGTTTVNAVLSSGGRIAGSVVDQTGAPLPGALIEVYDAGGYTPITSVTAGDDGAFRIIGLPSGAYKLSVSGTRIVTEWYRDAEYWEDARTVPVVFGQTTPGIDFVVASMGSIAGRVVDSSGLPLADVSVYAPYGTDWGAGYASTGADGYYRVDLPAGTCRVMFTKAGYVAGWYDSVADHDTARDVVVIARQTVGGIDARLVRYGVVAGRVTDAEDRPVANVSVFAFDVATADYCQGYSLTDADGRYEVTGLPPGLSKIQFWHESYVGVWHADRLDFASADAIAVANETVVSGLDARLARGAVISGAVADSAGRPVPDAYVAAYSVESGAWARSATSRADGTYFIGGLSDGSYKIQFGHNEFLTEWYDDAAALATAAVVATSSVQPATGIDARLSRAPRIAGRVADTTGAPLAGARVELWQGGSYRYAVTTDDAGDYLFANLSPDSYKVRFDMAGYAEQWYAGKHDLPSADAIVLALDQAADRVDVQLVRFASIAGRVTTPAGSPVPGVTVCALSSSSSCARADTTDANGDYEILELPPGAYKVRFARGGWVQKWYDNTYDYVTAAIVTVVDRERIAGIDAQLPEPGRIAGRVVDRHGYPLSGASVQVYQSSYANPLVTATTGTDGSYLTEPALSGNYRVRFSKAGYATEWRSDAVDRAVGAIVEVTYGQTTGGIDAELLLGGAVSGSVTDAGGNGIAGASVDAYAVPGGYRVTGASTSANGYYAIRNLLPGDYRIKFSRSGFLEEYYDDTPSAQVATTIHVANESETPGIDAQLVSKGAIAGRVTDANGNPVTNVRVYGYPTTETGRSAGAYTDGNGEYRLLSMEAGTYQVQFDAGGTAYLGEWYDDKPVQLGSDTVIVVDGVITQGIDAQLARGGSVAGTVTDSASRPIAGAYVQVTDEQGWISYGYVYTDGSGSYRVQGLPAGNYKVHFGANAYLEEWHNDKPDSASADAVSVTLGQETEVNAQLTLGGSIAGTVTDGAGEPIPNVYVELSDDQWYAGGTSTDGQGAYRFAGLEGGSYRVSFSPPAPHLREWFDDKPDYASADAVAVVVEQATENVDAQLALGGSLSGTVANATNAPIPGVLVSLYNEAGGRVGTQYTGASGGYRFTGLTGGSYRVGFDSSGTPYLSEWYPDRTDLGTAEPVTVAEEQETAGIDAQLALGGSVSGFVANAAGDPLENVTVRLYDLLGNQVNFAQTAIAGTYTMQRVEAGTYTVYFEPWENNSSYLSEWYDDKPDRGLADSLTISLAQLSLNLNAVLTRNTPPVLAAIGNKTVVEGEQLRIQLNATDVDANALFYSVPLLPAGADYDWTTRVVTWTPTCTEAGTYQATFRVSDGRASDAEAITITVVDAPTPDLALSSIEAPAEAWTTRAFDVSWTLVNSGAAPTAGSWADRVYLSADDQLGGDILLGEFPCGVLLGAGESLVRTQTFSIPREGIVEGPHRIIVVTDANGSLCEDPAESNNALASPQPVTLYLNALPDLVVASVEAPASAWSDQTVTVYWTTGNNGAGSTDAPSWHDRLYLSTDPDLDATDILGSDVQNASYLAAGESYSSTGSVRIPVGSSGTYYLIVKADVGGNVLEQDENNNVGIRAIPIQLTPPPDLRVDAVGAPDTAWSGQNLAATWTASNRGTGAVPDGQASWNDVVYLSVDTTLDAEDIVLGAQWHSGALAVDATYTATAQLRVPTGLSGDFYVIVVTDAGHQVYEHAAENNNSGFRATSTHVNLSPPPDLQVSSVTLPASGIAGQGLPVSWTVANQGSGETVPSSWRDSLYLSEDDVLQPELDRGALVSWHTGVLAGGESYTQAASIPLPSCQEGSYYLFVVTDTDKSVFEFVPGYDAEANNAWRSQGKVTVVSTSPDLQVSEVTPPASGIAGQPVDVSWVVANPGVAGTGAASWIDRVYFSRSSSFVPSESTQLGFFWRQGALDPGASYTQTGRVTLPVNAVGAYYLHVVADADDAVEECASEGNNASGSAGTFPVESRPPDLTASALQFPAEADSGRTVSISWNVSNSGVGPTVEPAWVDAVYLSSDTTLDTDADLRLATIPHEGTLAVGAGYPVAVSPKVPHGMSGGFYVFACADAGGAVFEGAGEGNNCVRGASPLQVNLSLAADLVVAAVDAPASALSGQTAVVTWTVANHGAAVTDGEAWTDYLYLSRDQILDATDPQVGYRQHTGVLDIGAQYEGSLALELPKGISGPYYVFVRTDRNGAIWESDEQNNTGHDVAAMQVDLPPPADLFVESVAVPAEAVPGREVDFAWRVGNHGPNVAAGGWVDSVYLSTDLVWDIRDTLVGRFAHYDSLAAAGAYDASVRARVPGVVPGAYHVIVRTDVVNSVRETDETNNAGASTETIAPDAVEIQLGSPVFAALLQGTEHYYKVHVPAGEDLRVSLDSASATGANELFVRYGAMPDAAHFDYLYDAPFMPDQEITVPTTREGWYFILVRGVQVPSPPVSFTVEASLLDFAVASVEPGSAGNGTVTFLLTGSKLRGDTKFVLTDSAGGIHDANESLLLTTTSVLMTFDLSVAAIGPASITAFNGEASAAGHARLTIVPASVKMYSFNISGPAALRPGQLGTWDIFFGNAGNIDIDLPLIIFRLPGARRLGFSASGTNFGEEVSFLGIPQKPLFNVLRPGDYIRASLFGQLDRASMPSVTLVDTGDNQLQSVPINYKGTLAHVPEDAQAAWQANFPAVQDEIGATYGEYFAGVRDELLSLSRRSQDYATVQLAEGAWVLRKGQKPSGDAVPIPPYESEKTLTSSPPGKDAGETSRIQSSTPECVQEGGDGVRHTYVVLVADDEYSSGDNLKTISTGNDYFDYFHLVKGIPERQIHTLFDTVGDGEAISDEQVLGQIRAINFGESYDADDNLVFAYLGHGSAGKKTAPKGSIITHDSYISSQMLNEALGCGKVGSKYVILDSCFSGALGDALTSPATAALTATNESLWSWTMPNSSGDYKMNFSSYFLFFLGTGVGVDTAFRITQTELWMQQPRLFNRDNIDLDNPWQDGPSEAAVAIAWDELPSAVSPFVSDVREWIAGSDEPIEVSPGREAILIKGEPTAIVLSRDPNEKTGPAGFGPIRLVGSDKGIPYSIGFENVADATAPAQRVTVSDALDASLDTRTFRLSEIAFGDHVISVPPNRSFYQQRIDLGAEHGGLLADVSAGLDVTTGTVVWTMTAIDPATGERPEDPSLGLLPPNDDTHRGEGHVSFTIKPMPGLVTGTVINNQALIVFDANEPIVTNTVFNTIDSGAPTSSVAALPAETEETQFTVSWSGEDDAGGSGIRDFTVYVSDDGAEYAPWKEATTDTSASFTGEVGHRYRFASVARDNVGNAEGLPASADAEILVKGPNQAPTLDAVGDRTVDEGQTLSFTVGASDAEAGALQFEASGVPDGAAFDPGTKTFAWTPTFAQSGSYEVTFTVSDDGTPPQSDSETVTITVTEVNRPPSIDAIADKVITAGSALMFTVTVIDPDADALTLSAEGLPSGASFDAATGAFAWVPGSDQSGSFPITFRATDDGAPPLSVTEDVIVLVGAIREVCPQGCAYDTVQAAINAANPHDVIQVAAGTYRENLRINKSLTLRRGPGLELPGLEAAGQGGPRAWFVVNGDADDNGAGDGSVVTIAPPANALVQVRLENIVLTGGWSETGGGLLATAAEGGTIDLVAVNTVVASNDALRGGGIALSADGPGSAVDLRLVNSTVGSNDAGQGGGIHAQGINGGAVTIDATNQIVWGNRSTTGEEVHLVQDNGGTVRASAAFSDIGGVSYGGDNLESWSAGSSVADADPLYANPGLLDLRLAAGSPAVDAGDAVAGLTEDFEGDPRPSGAGVDIGADEYAAPATFAALKLTALNGGERIAAGEPYLVTWGAPAGVGGFRVWYTVNGGTKWVSLTPTALSGTDRIVWQVPKLSANSTRCLVKVTGTLNGRTMSDVSDKPFTVEVVRLLSPNGKEHLLSGGVVPIAWKTFGTSQPVATTQVQYSVDGGSIWKTVTTLSGNPGSWAWTVPAAVASLGKCRVQVVLRAVSGAIVGKDASDANFSAGKVLVLAPNGGGDVASGGTVDVAWAAVAEAASFDLYYTLNGTTYLPLPGGQHVTGTTWRGAWPVASGNMPKSGVKVLGYAGGGALVGSDVSDAFFGTTVVRVQSPNGGETLVGGASTTITWVTNATIRTVAKTTVATTVNGGTSWSKTVLDGNPGLLRWTPVRPDSPLTKCKIRVELRDANGALVGTDISDALFAVQP
jgi:protocatechuate 3,4-dioxygenase beta subunit/subtilase family serine protease